MVGFCSNDYLGLADHPALTSGPRSAAGSTGSRLITGDLPIHRHLESRLARLLGFPDAVLFPSGFQANVGALPALLTDQDQAHSDALNHASLIDGLRLSRSGVSILPHRQAPPLPTPMPSALSWWVTESIFSMDGDTADADALRRYQAAGGCVYLDEAHALGLFAAGTGWAATHGVVATVALGTLGKALGCAGAFLASSETVCHWLRTRARSFVFTTGSSPALLHRIDQALDLATGPVGDAARERLRRLIARFAAHFAAEVDCDSPILPFIIGDNTRTTAIAQELLDRGWHVQPIRPPTVPPGTARLRITLSAAHTEEEIDAFARALRDTFASHALEPSIPRARTCSPASVSSTKP